MTTVFILLIVYQLKHFIADYPLQTPYMLGKFKEHPHYILPLLCHVAVHGMFTFIIVAMVRPNYAPAMALLDMAVHFVMDRVKASPNLLGYYKPLSPQEYKDLTYQLEEMQQDTYLPNGPASQAAIECTKDRFRYNVYFWWALGLDQGVHHLTHYFIIYLVVT
jgi:hypothetical protein